MTYDEAQAYVSGLAPRGWRLGLDRMAEFARRAGLERLDQKFIHIAGTNGKGSVTAFVQSILAEAGVRSGAFFSPFVYDPRERIQLGREYIPKADFARIVSALRPIEESLYTTEFGGVTEFEMKTAVGFQFWKERRCEWVALEVGLGGRLDSTNIIDPACSVIVSIGLDHTAVLGSTYAEIAFEKAGVIKADKPVVVGSVPEKAMEVIIAEARQRNAPLWRLGEEIELESDEGGYRVNLPDRSVGGLVPGLRGVCQPENMALAIAACARAGVQADDEAIRRGVKRAFVPGRFEKRSWNGGTVILDGAHNAEAAEVLAQSLQQCVPGERFALVTGMVAGHDPSRFYRPLADVVDQAFACPIGFHRALPAADVATAFPPTWRSGVCDSITEGLSRAHGTGLPILVTGSFYLVGEAGNAIRSGWE